MRLLFYFLLFSAASFSQKLDFDEKYHEVDDSMMVYIIADTMPRFTGGDSALIIYLKEKVRYPDLPADQRVYVKTYIQFVVEKDGSTSQYQIMKVQAAGPTNERAFEQETKRLIKNMPPWTPGYLEGKKVRTRMVLPVKFVVPT